MILARPSTLAKDLEQKSLAVWDQEAPIMDDFLCDAPVTSGVCIYLPSSSKFLCRSAESTGSSSMNRLSGTQFAPPRLYGYTQWAVQKFTKQAGQRQQRQPRQPREKSHHGQHVDSVVQRCPGPFGRPARQGEWDFSDDQQINQYNMKML